MFQCILVFTGLNYDGNKYADYRFPGWANLLGWVLTFSSVAVVPAVAVRKIFQEEGSLTERVRKLVQCNPDWKPMNSPVKGELGGPGDPQMKTFQKLAEAQTEAEKSHLL